MSSEWAILCNFHVGNCGHGSLFETATAFSVCCCSIHDFYFRMEGVSLVVNACQKFTNRPLAALMLEMRRRFIFFNVLFLNIFLVMVQQLVLKNFMNHILLSSVDTHLKFRVLQISYQQV